MAAYATSAPAPPSYAPPPTREQARDHLAQAYREMADAARAVAQAIVAYDNPTQGCSFLLERAFTQLSHARENVYKAKSCVNLPPSFQENAPFIFGRGKHGGWR